MARITFTATIEISIEVDETQAARNITTGPSNEDGAWWVASGMFSRMIGAVQNETYGAPIVTKSAISPESPIIRARRG